MTSQQMNGNTHPIGHNSREFDIERTAKEIQREARAEFIRTKVRPNTCYVLKCLLYAAASGMKCPEFMEYFMHLAYADWKDGTKSEASRKTRALIRGVDVKTCERSTKELEKDGWLTDIKRRRRDPTIRTARIPQAILDAIPLEVRQPTKMSVRDFRTDKNVWSKPLFEVLEQTEMSDQGRTKMSVQDFRTDKNGGQSYTVVVEEENYISAREDGCRLEGLQLGQGKEGAWQGEAVETVAASPECLSDQQPVLVTTQRFERFYWLLNHWGLKNGQAALTEVRKDTARCWLDGIARLGSDFDFKTQEDALDNALSTAEATVYNPPDAKDRKGPSACKNFCETTFRGKLVEIDRLRRAKRKAEHDDRVDALTVEEQAKERLNGTKTRTTAYNQAAVKRIETAPPKGMNGHASERFRDNDFCVQEVRKTKINGTAANSILDAVPGATVKMVRDGLLKAAAGEQLPDDPKLERVLSFVTNYCIFELHSKPESRCGGPIAVLEDDYGRKRKMESAWVCLSQSYFDGLLAKYPMPSGLYGLFEDLTKRLAADAETYPGLQAKFEAEFEAKAAEKYAEIERERIAEAEEKSLGILSLQPRWMRRGNFPFWGSQGRDRRQGRFGIRSCAPPCQQRAEVCQNAG